MGLLFGLRFLGTTTARLMIRAAILIDGGYFLRRLPTVRSDVDVSDPKAVADAINDLILGHLNQLNYIYKVPNSIQLLL